jgi:hypothetical protein
MMRGRARVNHIMSVVEELRDGHWWTVGAVGVRWEQARRLARELSIEVLRWPIADEAFTLGQPEGFVAILRNDLRGRRPTQILLHEIGHVVLHMSGEHGLEKHLYPCKRGDPREAEAELFARMLYYGPKAGPDNNAKIAEAVGAIEGGAARKRQPVQLPLELPESTPEYRPPSTRMGHGSYNPDAIRRTKKGQRPRLLGSTIGLGVSHDSLRFDWSKEGKPLRFFHYELGWLDVYDGLLTGHEGRPKWEIIQCGDRRATRRRFVVSSTDRRDYWFSEGEKRTRSVDALNTQIARAERSTIGHRPESAKKIAAERAESTDT